MASLRTASYSSTNHVRSFESVRDQYYKTVRPMHLQFVEPSKRWADVILPEGGDNSVGLDLIVSKVRSVLAARG